MMIDFIYHLISEGNNKVNEKIFKYFKSFHENGTIFNAVNTSYSIISRAVNEKRVSCNIYFFTDSSENISEIEKEIKEHFRSLDRAIEIELGTEILSTKTLCEKQEEIFEKYYTLNLSPEVVQTLHEKIYSALSEKSVKTAHMDEEVIKTVVFNDFPLTIEDTGISYFREERGRKFFDYIICFFPREIESTTISHELAHKLGLIHVYDPYDIMNEGIPALFFPEKSRQKFRKWSKKQWRFIKSFYEK